MLFVSVVAPTHQDYAGKVLLVLTDACVLKVAQADAHSAQQAHQCTAALLLTDIVPVGHTTITAV
jgi:hypothetical protein